MVNNNINSQINYGAIKDNLPQNVNEKLPQGVQNFDVKNSVNNNAVMKSAQDKEFTPLTAGLMGGVWLTFAQISQKMNDGLNKAYGDSWLGKIGQFGDKISDKLGLTGKPKAVKTKVSQFADKFELTKALKTPTRAENTFAVNYGRGIQGFVMGDVNSMLQTHVKQGGGDDIIKLVDGIKGKSFANADEALKFISDDLFKHADDAVNKDAINELITRMSKVDKSINVDKLFGKIPNVPFLKRKGSFAELANKLNSVFGEQALKTVDNAGNVISQGAKSALGKGLSKNVLSTFEGLTNGAAGGKLMIGIQALFFAQAIEKAINAPEGEKLSTFTENVANDLGMFMSIPYQVKASHLLGGLKYTGIKGAGTQVENVDAYRKAIKELNEKVASETISKIDYVAEKARIKDMLDGGSKWYHKPFKAIGKFFSTGLDAETVKPFVTKADNKSMLTGITNGLQSLVNKVKGPGAGTAIRLGTAILVVSPLISKAVTSVSHLIFGKPTNSILDEDKTDEAQAPEATGAPDANNPLGMTQEELMAKLESNPELMAKMESDPAFLEQLLNDPTQLVKILNGEMKIEDVQASTPQSKYITNNPQAPVSQATPAPSAPSAINNTLNNNPTQAPKTPAPSVQNNAPTEPTRSYVPSSAPVQLGLTQQEQEKSLALNDALLKADNVEKAALEQLGSL